jgi:hypothetical protein
MMNDETGMTNDEGSTNAQMTKEEVKSFRHSDFVIISAFGIRHSAFFP